MLDQVALVREPLPLSPLLPQGADDLFRGVTRPEEAASLGVTRRLGTRFFQELMPDEQGRAQCPARITGRRLDPDVVECPVAQQTAIGHAIEPDAACHDEVLHAGLRANVAADAKEDLLGHILDAGRQVHVPLLEGGLRITGPPPEEPIEPPPRHGQPLAVREVIHVEPETAVALQVDEMLQDRLPVDRPAVRSQPHQFVFTAVYFKTAVIGKRRVEEAERMGKCDVVDESDPVSLADPERGRAPLADPVERDDRRFVEGAREERTGGMGLVVIGKDQARIGRRPERAPDRTPHVQLVPEPQGHGQAEAPKAGRGIGQIRLQEPFELGQGLIIEGYVIELVGAEPPLAQAISNRLRREARIMLDPGKPFLLSGRDDPTIVDQRRGAIMIKSGYA